MKIHLMSDMHIERGYSIESQSVSADICVLAGDICIAAKPDLYRLFLQRIKPNYQHIILVLGNHEFYHAPYQHTLDVMRALADECGVHLMDVALGTDNLTLDGVKFWGSTLWTDLNNNDWFARQRVKNSLADFKVIGEFDISKHLDLHLNTVEHINWDADVIITHHMPILRKHSRFEITDMSYGFGCTNLEQQIHDSNVKLWLHGHTHDNCEFDLNGTRIISNQVGYSGEIMIKPYNPELIIEV